MGVLSNFGLHKQLSNLHPLEDTWPLGFWGGQKRYPEGQGVNFDPPYVTCRGLKIICTKFQLNWFIGMTVKVEQTNKQTKNALY